MGKDRALAAEGVDGCGGHSSRLAGAGEALQPFYRCRESCCDAEDVSEMGGGGV